MPTYTERLMIDQVNHNFNFTRNENLILQNYLVEVFRLNTLLASFSMNQQKDGTWTIQPPAPTWCMQIEERLSEVLNRINRP